MTKKPPDGLGSRGRSFWRAIAADFDLSKPEAELLLETCRTLDLVEALQADLAAGVVAAGKVKPAATEIRQQRLALGRLLGQLDIPGPDELTSPASARGRKAARSRWETHHKREAS